MAEDHEIIDTIYASEVAGCKFCVSSEDGQSLHERIKEALLEGKRVFVSFAGISDISSAFMDAAIGQLYREPVLEKKLDERLVLLGLSKDDAFLLERIILRAKYYCGKPEQHDAAVCKLLGEEE